MKTEQHSGSLNCNTFQHVPGLGKKKKKKKKEKKKALFKNENHKGELKAKST